MGLATSDNPGIHSPGW